MEPKEHTGDDFFFELLVAMRDGHIKATTLSEYMAVSGPAIKLLRDEGITVKNLPPPHEDAHFVKKQLLHERVGPDLMYLFTEFEPAAPARGR